MGETNRRLETEVLTALRRVIRAMDLDAKQLARHTGLTTSQLLVLELLSDTSELAIGRIAEGVGLTQGTVTTMVDKLESRGLVARRRGHADRRQVKVSLAEEGRALLEAAPPALQTRFIEEFSRLKTWERHAIVSALEHVAELMGVAGIDASPVLDVRGIGETPPTG